MTAIDILYHRPAAGHVQLEALEAGVYRLREQLEHVESEIEDLTPQRRQVGGS